MKYLLDTNICIYIIKNKPQSVLNRFLSIPNTQFAISSITVAELFYGVAKRQFPEKNEIAIKNFLLPLTILSFDENAAEYFGKIKANLEKKGTPVGGFDIMIAAHAISENLTLITNNEREFNRIEGLKVENWVAEN